MKNRSFIIALGALLALAALFFTAKPARAENRVLIDRVVAAVGGEVITLSETRQAAELNPDAPPEKILESLIDQKVIEIEARKQGIEITDKEIAFAIDRHIEDMGVTREDFDALLAKEGVSFDDYRAKVRADLLKIKFVRNTMEGDVEISDDEALNYYRRHPDQFLSQGEIHVARIFLPFPMGTNEDEKQKVRDLAGELRGKIEAGENFADLAKKYSRSADAADGGDLGWVNPKDLAPEFADVAERLEAGKISDVIELESGCYLIKVVEKKTAQIIPFDDVKEKVRQYLYSLKIVEQLDKLIAEAKREIPIERTPE